MISVSIAWVAALGLAAPVEVYAAGDVADCRKVPASESMAERTAALIPPGATVLMLGDAVYQYATRDGLANCYDPTWGIHRSSTMAVAGNHDRVDGSTEDFRDYFGQRTGAEGYFARRLGAWLVVGLDSDPSFAGSSTQLQWLEATLEENRDARCTLAMWHVPLHSSGLHRGRGEHMRPYWALLERYGAEVVLNGHEHFYEAFDPLDAAGRPAGDGIREFVVGTGGARLYGFWRPPYESRARIRRHGVLHLTLGDGGYAWQFTDVDGNRADPGAARCR
jgi:hypothetical protein